MRDIILSYKGYNSNIIRKNNIFYGHVISTKCDINLFGKNFNELIKDFHSKIDKYIRETENDSKFFFSWYD